MSSPRTKSPTALIKPLNVPVKKDGAVAAHGNDRTYELIKAGEYDSFIDNGRRFVTMASIEARQARLLAETSGTFKPAPFKGQAEPLKPHKHKAGKAGTSQGNATA